MSIADELRSILSEAKQPKGNPKLSAGGLGGYAVEITLGLQKLDHSIKGKGTGFKKGSVEGDIRVTEAGDGFRVEVITHGRRPASLMFTTGEPVTKVATSSLPKQILDKLNDKQAFAEEVLAEGTTRPKDATFPGTVQGRHKAHDWLIDHGFKPVPGSSRYTKGDKTGRILDGTHTWYVEIEESVEAGSNLGEGATPGARAKGTGHGRGETSASGEFWSGKYDKMDGDSSRKKRFNKAQRQGKKAHIDASMKGESLSSRLATALEEDEDGPDDLDESVGSMDSEEFSKALLASAKPRVGEKWLTTNYYNQFNSSRAVVYVTFVNGPTGMVGAQAMNNRTQFSIEGFAHELGQPPPSGKVTLKTMSGRKETRLKGKTGSPEAIVKYLSDHLAKIAEMPTIER